MIFVALYIYIIIYLFIYLTFLKMPQTAKPELQNFKERSFGNKGCVRVQLKETPGRKLLVVVLGRRLGFIF